MFTREDLTNVPVINKGPVEHLLCQVEITESDVYDVLRSLKTDKSPGPDNIHPRVLKECARELAESLAALFQTSMKEGKIPQEWKGAN